MAEVTSNFPLFVKSEKPLRRRVDGVSNELQQIVTSLVKVHREYSPEPRILHTKFDLACDAIFVASKWF